jgi:hypothetical protein
MERVGGRAFKGFQEGTIRFPPTYNYLPGTDKYDERPDKPIRPPAWCDRVLWCTPVASDDIRLLYYGRTEQVSTCIEMGWRERQGETGRERWNGAWERGREGGHPCAGVEIATLIGMMFGTENL